MAEAPTSSNPPGSSRLGALWFWLQFALIGALVATGLRTRGDAEGVLLFVAVALGSLLIAMGAALIFSAIRRLSSTPMPQPGQPAELVTDGVYAYVRHPMYLGIIVTSLGYGVALDSVWALVVACLFGVFLDLKSRREESLLRAQYPEYEDYARHVKRLVPYFY
jgi:protein-S-isoprenylcysteine O-methyltransferase Ste14